MPPDNANDSKLGLQLYRDGASPTVRAVGETLERAVRTALRPVDGVLWSVDQAFDWMSEAVARRLARTGVDGHAVVPPDPVMEARVLQELQSAGPAEDASLRELLVGLLATSMAPQGRLASHPLYLATLRQLTPTEARILCALAASPTRRELALVRFASDYEVGYFTEVPAMEPSLDQSLLPPAEEWYPFASALSMQPDMFDTSISHLDHLGVVELDVTRQRDGIRGGVTDVPGAYDAAYRLFQARLSPAREWVAATDAQRRSVMVSVETQVTLTSVCLTDWAAKLADACDAVTAWEDLARGHRLPHVRPRLATYEDLLALTEDVRAEIVAGEIRSAPGPLPRHSRALRAIGSYIGRPFDVDDGRGGPGGWWILVEVDVRLSEHDIVRPDVAGCRRERLPEPWDTRPIDMAPDWVCEIISPSNAAYESPPAAGCGRLSLST